MGDLSKSEDLKNTVKQFIHDYQANNKAIIKSYRVEGNVATGNAFSGIASLEFEYKIGKRKKAQIKTGKAIMKIPSLAPMPQEEIKNFQVLFDREVLFYKTILPELYKLGQCKPFAPIFYTATETNAMVMEDLRADGFKPGERSFYLDWYQCLKSLEVLATYHAFGYKYLQSLDMNDPRWRLIALAPMGKPDTNDVDDFMKVMEPYLNEGVHQKILQLRNEIAMLEEYPNENRMYVLIHGDFRSDNIFFKYDSENKPCEAKIIDWQLSRENNPVIDLFFFFSNNLPVELLLDYGDDVLNYYLEILNKNLALSKANRSYDRLELDSDIVYYKHITFDVIISGLLKSVQRATSAEDPSLANAIRWLVFMYKVGIFS
ncbi:hypothetical protein V9T40_005945 [Parthenolecanium corni]|uniref:CHK kinase-like domain-containing protein n=1 Tax=Parthenolecanium corni TaxID=536013 RepID=A0AAN9YAX8_9HEMI